MGISTINAKSKERVKIIERTDSNPEKERNSRVQK
jgi:hypothetical protein